MADIFVSYKRQDHEQLQRLLSGLSTYGWTVWRDKGIGTGKPWSEAWTRFIERELAAAKCVLVAWSKGSIEAPWVHHNARIGRERGCLVQVVLDGVSPPEAFQSLPSVDLSQRLLFDPRINDIATSVRRIAGDGSRVRPVRRPVPRYMYVVTHSDAARACHDRGRARRFDNLIVSAIAAFSRAIELDPGFAAAYRDRAVAYYEEASYDRVISDCGKAIEIHPEDAYSRGLCGLARAARQDFDGAIADYDQAIALDPELEHIVGLYYRRGRAYDARGEYDAAIASYTEAIQQGLARGLGLEFSYYFDRARAYERRASAGDRDRAVTDYLTGLQGNPAHGEGYPATALNTDAENALARLSGAP